MTRFRHTNRLTSLLVGLASVVLAGSTHAQGTQATVLTGSVKSEQGQPLQGANVVITELNVSVGTNEQGVYRVTLAPERVRGQTVVMRIRAIGFQPQQKSIVIAAGTITTDFTLKIDINRLSEVVVTGVTGATETKKLAFSVAKVDKAELQAVPGTHARRRQILPMRQCAYHDVFLDAEARKGLEDLESAGDAVAVERVRAHPGDVPAVEAHGSRVRREKSRDEVEQRGLAGAVRPDEADDPALADIERDVAAGEHAAEPLGHSAHF